MKHVKTFEYGYDAFIDAGGNDYDYLETPEYFIETYINGQYGQLEKMLSMFRERNRMEELINYMDETMKPQDANDLKNWMLKN